ncbi:MAG: neutral/alkaline non-lysosomal ceramidase N-terminal domain-containing protein [Prolixibacteraceae bacterium]|nr:neutral/alkaline non-lysosomal ceramidase N-terminal domain-containing protein [Prolixibacteraceae bacterium]
MKVIEKLSGFVPDILTKWPFTHQGLSDRLQLTLSVFISFKIRSHIIALLTGLLLFTGQINLSAGEVLQKGVFKAGAAAVKITPPVGSIMGNSYGITVSEGVHDDLHSKAIVFEKDGVKAAFIALDLISLPHVIVVKTRELISEKIGIPSNNIIMTATHVHAGPQMNPMFWDAAGEMAKQKSQEYLENLPSLIATSVQQADEKIQPVRVSVGRIDERGVNFNRRFLMKDGSFRMNPGRLNAQSVRPVGPVDPDLYVVYFETYESKPLAILVNFALHPAIVGGNQFSSDFPGVIADRLAEVKGDELVTIFSNGTSGNINHIDVNRKDQLGGYDESTRIGTILAADVMKVCSSLKPVDVNFLKIQTEKVELPVPSVTPAEVAWAQDVISKYGKPQAPSFNDVVQAWRIIDLIKPQKGNKSRYEITTTVPLTEDGRAIMSEVQTIILGKELVLVGFPGDAFVELGLAIKQNSPFPYTIVSEQSGNGNISYVPNRKAFPEGGYEAVSARFSPGGGEMLVDAAVRMLIDIYPY